LNFFWQSLVYPRLGLSYGWGGSLSPDPGDSTDCSGWVSAALSALMRGPDMIYQRQFWTGTFAGIGPGPTGVIQGIADTADLVCAASLADVPPDAAMIIAILQTGPDPSLAADAHMICSVRGVVTEMGGAPNNFHTSAQPKCTQIDDPEFNQYLFLPGPVTPDAPDYTAPAVLALLQRQFAA
jgi:hypothetical protein